MITRYGYIGHRKSNFYIYKVLIFIYLFVAVLEKIKWNIGSWGCDLFTLCTPILFCMLCILHIIEKRPVLINNFERGILTYYFINFSYVLLQFVLIDNEQEIHTQYLKGIITTLISILAVINVIMMMDFNYDDEENGFDCISKIFFAVTFINALYCLAQNFDPNIDKIIVNFTKSTVTRYGLDSYGSIGRVTGLLLESNFNGPFLLLGTINGIYLFEKMEDSGKHHIKRLATLLIIVLCFAECILTFSLTTYIGIGVFIVYRLLKSGLRHKGQLLFAIIVALICLTYVYFNDSVINEAINAKFSIFGNSSALENSSHFRIMVQSFSIFFMSIRNVLFGTGINCLNVYFQKYYGYTMMKAHSYYLQTLCEMGVVGFIIALNYIYQIFRISWRHDNKSNLLKLLLFVTVFTNFTYDPFTRNFNFILLMLGIALSQDLTKERNIV